MQSLTEHYHYKTPDSDFDILSLLGEEVQQNIIKYIDCLLDNITSLLYTEVYQNGE